MTFNVLAALAAAACLARSGSADRPPEGIEILDWAQIRAEYQRYRHGGARRRS